MLPASVKGNNPTSKWAKVTEKQSNEVYHIYAKVTKGLILSF